MRGRRMALAGLLLAACGSSEPGAECRVYATKYQGATGDAASAFTCTFDREHLTLACTNAQPGLESARMWSNSNTWGSLADAVASNRPVGRITSERSRSASGTCDVTRAHVFDAQKRLVGTQPTIVDPTKCGAVAVTFDAWDPAGRPTHGTGEGVGLLAACKDYVGTYSYEDAGGTVTFIEAGGPDCSQSTSTTTYDSQGLVVRSSFRTPSGASEGAVTNLATDTICP